MSLYICAGHNYTEATPNWMPRIGCPYCDERTETRDHGMLNREWKGESE